MQPRSVTSDELCSTMSSVTSRPLPMTHNGPRHGGGRLLFPGGLKQHQQSSALHKHCSTVTYSGDHPSVCSEEKKRPKDTRDSGKSWVRRSCREEWEAWEVRALCECVCKGSAAVSCVNCEYLSSPKWDSERDCQSHTCSAARLWTQHKSEGNSSVMSEIGFQIPGHENETILFPAKFLHLR